MLSVKTRSIIPTDSYVPIANVKAVKLGNENYLSKNIEDSSIVNHATLASSNVPINVKDGSYTPDSDDALYSIALGFKFDEYMNSLEYAYASDKQYPVFIITKGNRYLIKLIIKTDVINFDRVKTFLEIQFADYSEDYHFATFALQSWHPIDNSYYSNVATFDDIYNILVQNWHDIVITKSANSISLYINGTLLETKNFTLGSNGLSFDQVNDTSGDYLLSIAKYESWSYFSADVVSGIPSLLIDNFIIFKRHTLTAAEVLELYNIKRNGANDGNFATHSQQAKMWCWYQMGDHASDNFTAGQTDGCYDAKNTTTSPTKHLNINAGGFDYLVEEGQMP